MFDNAPPNLPVAPSAPVPPPRPPMPGASGPMPRAPLGEPPATMPTAVPAAPAPMMTSGTGKKEPEDIFSGIESGPGPMKPSSGAGEPIRRGFPTKPVLILLGVLVVLGAIGFAVRMFVFPPSPPPSPAPIPVKPPVVETPPPVVETPPTTTLPVGVTIPVPNTKTSPGEGMDSDSDRLTDVEEPYYDSDPTKNDTNGNGYPDGSEVRNLYDPSVSGQSLAKASYISRLTWNGWSFLAPKPWSIVPDLASPDRASVLTGSATRFLLTRVTNPAHDPIDAWLAKQARAAPTVVKTKSGITGRVSADGLTTYLPSGDIVLIFTYDLNGDPAYEYRTSYAMVVASMTSTP